MPFHMFGPPHFHILPIVLSSALTIAAGAYVIARYGVPATVTKLGTKMRDQVDAWRTSRRERSTSPTTMYSGAGGGAGSRAGNAAFDAYRAETLKKLEDEGAAFRAYLDGLRHAKDRSEFDAFLSERRVRETKPSTP